MINLDNKINKLYYTYTNIFKFLKFKQKKWTSFDPFRGKNLRAIRLPRNLFYSLKTRHIAMLYTSFTFLEFGKFVDNSVDKITFWATSIFANL